MLTATEEYPLAGICRVLHRRNACVFVTAIAERLLAAFATRAPEVRFALFYFHGIGRLLGDDRCGHELVILSCFLARYNPNRCRVKVELLYLDGCQLIVHVQLECAAPEWRFKDVVHMLAISSFFALLYKKPCPFQRLEHIG